jgi:hypothetical protein
MLLKCSEIDNETIEEICTIKHFGTINDKRINEHLAESNQMQVYDYDSKFSPCGILI